MTRPWFRTQPQLLERIKRDVEARYTDLRVIKEGDTVYIRGSFPVVHDGHTLDRYQIEVVFPSDYPRSLPKVRETGGRIPRVIDRHVYPRSGNACLFVEEQWLVNVGGEPSFLELLDGPLRNFLIGQSLVEAGQPWPFGERSHGIEGLLEAYGEWFGTQDEATIVRHLEYLSREIIKGHWECPCGSRKNLRNCHLDEVRGLQTRIPHWLARQALERLRYAQRVREEVSISKGPWGIVTAANRNRDFRDRQKFLLVDTSGEGVENSPKRTRETQWMFTPKNPSPMRPATLNQVRSSRSIEA